MSKIKSLLKSSRVRTTLALVVIGLAVIVVLLGGSREADPNIGLGADPETPTVGITNPVATLTVNRSLVYQHVTITVITVQEASAFSDDRKHDGAYTVRVQVHVQPGNEIQSPQGFNYLALVRLILPTGEAIAPKLISVLPLIVPLQPNDGYFDFPLPSTVDLSSLTLRVGTANAIAFTETAQDAPVIYAGGIRIKLRKDELASKNSRACKEETPLRRYNHRVGRSS